MPRSPLAAAPAAPPMPGGCAEAIGIPPALDAARLTLLDRTAASAFQGAQVFASEDPGASEDFLKRVFLREGAHRLKITGAPGDFRTRMRLLQLDDMSVSTLRYGTALDLTVENACDRLLITTQLRGSSRLSMGGRDFCGGAGLVAIDSGQEMVRKSFSADSERINLSIDRPAMEALATQLSGVALQAPLRFAPAMGEGSAVHGHWLDAMQALLGHAQAAGAALRHPWFARRMQESLMLLLLLEQPHNHAPLAQPLRQAQGPSVAPGRLRQAEAFIQAHAREPLTLGDIAGAAGISIRGLSDAFRTHRQTTPMAYLRGLRLDGARRELRGEAGAGGAPSVTGVALRWGFLHLGKFAGEYRRRFGELPSATRRVTVGTVGTVGTVNTVNTVAIHAGMGQSPPERDSAAIR